MERCPYLTLLLRVCATHVFRGSKGYLTLLISDKALAGVPRSKIRDQLLEVGFDDARQSEIVAGLSGGWKMKLELARAMLYNADLLLLDEVRDSIFGVTVF